MRYSAGSDDDGGLTEAYRPFYSPTGTVSTIRLGQLAPDLSWPASTKIRTNAELPWSGQPDDELAVQDVPPAQNPPAGRVGDSFDMLPVRSQPMARSPQELEKLISGDPGSAAQGPRAFLQGKDSRSAQYRDQMEQLQRELKRISDEAAELRQSVQALTPAASQGTKDEGRGTMEEPRPSERVQSNRGLRPGLQDVTEQFNRQESPAEVRAKLDKLVASASQSATAGPNPSPPELSQSTVAAEGTRLAGAENPPGTRVQARDQQLMTRGTPEDQAGTTNRASATTYDIRRTTDENRATSLTALQEVNRLSAQEVSTEAKRVLGGHEDYNSYSANKFEQYFKAGQEYLKQGKYYRAVDAYTLASVYKAGPAGSLGQREAAALVYAGKSLALFAAGEYISSALFLSRALQADQISNFKFQIPIPADKLDSRIADAEECLRLCRETGQQTTVGELQFLLGYIYLRTGRLAEAKRAIDEACEKLPDAPTLTALEKVIDQAMARQRVNN